MVHDRCYCCFSFWAIFCPFTPLTAQKMKISKKWRKCQEISSFYTLVPKVMIIGYTVPEIWCMAHVILFLILSYFLPFYPSNSPKNENFKRMKKTPGDIILHTWTKSYDYRLYCSWDMVHDTCNFYFWSWANFCPFTTPSSPPSPAITVQKIKYQRMDGRTDGLI